MTTLSILPSQNNGEQNSIYSVMEKQNEITALLIQQQSLSSIPKREIQVFDGDPLQNQSFIKSFEHSIGSKNDNYRDCLYYLEQYTRGQAKAMDKALTWPSINLMTQNPFKLTLFFCKDAAMPWRMWIT